ncbi:DinB family protein [Mumia sp. zg.B53]|uniref:DinB family protein n=1 Tax=Mumia sp. zg.B53 TaxID=2855449 RepID=UPI001C6E157E|nr:DinB family protein [Mumia sp. zg.B53]MBW9215887.1 DinB family protein [Mumia sp. zg.B53]
MTGERREFVDEDLSGARVVRSDLADVVMRGVYVAGMDLDTPDLADGPLFVNGIDVAPYVESELAKRFPGRELKDATDADGLREAWSAVEAAWAGALVTARGREGVSVDGEWTFAQTLRHLVMATDVWLKGAIFGEQQPYHPIGQPFAEFADTGGDVTIFREPTSYEEILAVRGEHQALVREFLDHVTHELLAQPRVDPWRPTVRVSVLQCLHVVLNEEWEHLRFALRDLEIDERGRS